MPRVLLVSANTFPRVGYQQNKGKFNPFTSIIFAYTVPAKTIFKILYKTHKTIKCKRKMLELKLTKHLEYYILIVMLFATLRMFTKIKYSTQLEQLRATLKNSNESELKQQKAIRKVIWIGYACSPSVLSQDTVMHVEGAEGMQVIRLSDTQDRQALMANIIVSLQEKFTFFDCLVLPQKSCCEKILVPHAGSLQATNT